jgi:hypothetical protein
MEEMQHTSIVSSTGGTGASFLGFLPGFGFAGMTHSFEAASVM